MLRLTVQQERARAAFQEFVRARIAPHADAWDREERLPAGVVAELAGAGHLGALVPAELGGAGMDALTFGLLNESIGAGCSSVRSVLTVHSMVAHAIARWGTPDQRERWLPRLAAGESVAAFALTEPGAGSDATALETTARPLGGGYVLDGHKRWITYGQCADLFLVFTRCAGRIAAFLVERAADGMTVEPMRGLLGTRASMVAEVRLRECRVPAEALLGRVGFGLSAVGSSALDVGRYSVAWGCVGMAQACLEASIDHAGSRRQFGRRLRDQQLVQRMIASMATSVSAARLLCWQAACQRHAGDPRSVVAACMAKYFASRSAFRVASDAVQVHGALGCGAGSPVQRHLRDAKVMEIIEGSTEIQETMLAEAAYQGHFGWTAVAGAHGQGDEA